MSDMTGCYFLVFIALKMSFAFVYADDVIFQGDAPEIVNAILPKEVAVPAVPDPNKGYMFFKHFCNYRKKNTDYTFIVNILNPGNKDISCVFDGHLETSTNDESSCNGDPNAEKGCGNFCRRCSTRYSLIKMPCLKMCYVDGCECKEGYILDDYTGKCVLPQECSLTV